MIVRVRCFAATREIIGASELSVDLPEGSTLIQLVSRLQGQFPQLQTLTESLLFSVNQEYASTDMKLTAGDEIALIPPVSGGADD